MLTVNPELTTLLDTSRPSFDHDALGEPDTRGRPVRVHVRRADVPSAPLVVMSHGTGGAAQDLGWWADALCTAGFDVAAIDHHGNTYTTGYVAEAFVWPWDRALDVSVVLDRVPARGPVGVCGFSIGGYTAAAVCGARIAGDLYRAAVDGTIDVPPPPEFPTIREELRARHGNTPGTPDRWAGLAAADYHDPRVEAAFLLCPSVGPLITEESLATVAVPVAVRWTEGDTEAPPAQNGRRYAALIPGADGGPVGTPASGHYGFVVPEADDAAAKADVVTDSVAFFTRTLRADVGIDVHARVRRDPSPERQARRRAPSPGRPRPPR